MLRVVDIMSRNVVAADPNMTCKQAADLMAQEGVSSLIVAEGGTPLGIVTETDITRDVVSKGTPIDASVRTIMSAPLYYSSPDADIIEVANAMTTNKVKKIPVIEGGNIIGIVTQTDIIRHIFRAVRSLERAHKQGQLSTQQYAEKFSSLFHNFTNAMGDMTKNWYMRCNVCANTFMNPEKDGIMSIKQCPRCGSVNLKYDPSPSV